MALTDGEGGAAVVLVDWSCAWADWICRSNAAKYSCGNGGATCASKERRFDSLLSGDEEVPDKAASSGLVALGEAAWSICASSEIDTESEGEPDSAP